MSDSFGPTFHMDYVDSSAVKMRSKVSLSKIYGLVVNVRSEVEASKGQGKTMKVLYALYSLYLCLLNIFQENFKLCLFEFGSEFWKKRKEGNEILC